MSPLGCLFLNCLLGGFYDCIHISAVIQSSDAVLKQIPQTVPFTVQLFSSQSGFAAHKLDSVWRKLNWGFDPGMCQMFSNSYYRNKRPNQ